MEQQTIVRILSPREVMDRTSLSRATLYRKRGSSGPDRFPAPVVLSEGRIGWWEAEVEAWISSRPKRERA